MVKIIKVSDEFFTDFDIWRENITKKNEMKRPLSRPEASDLLRGLLPDINVSIDIIPRRSEKKIKLDLNLRRRSR